ncbi:MAG: DNA polymerase Y family protein [Longimicrobiales bacterium]
MTATSTGTTSSDFGSPSRSSSGRGSARALCLWLPTFELRLELVRSPELDTTSVALLAPEEGSRRTIWQVSERAHTAGVRSGQLVSRAVGLCPSLTLLEPDPAHYDAARSEMVRALTEVSPVVEPAGRGRVFLGMDGLERLYGSPKNQARRALRALFSVFPGPLVAATRAGWAPGKFGAWVAAVRARPGEPVVVPEKDLRDFLAGCPVSALPVEERMHERLERLGVSTLGELARLPASALTGQFGEEGRKARAWATGERIDPVRPVHRPRPVRAALDFPSPMGHVQALHAALEKLTERALSRPARRGRSVREVRLRARLEGGGSWSVVGVLRQPTARSRKITSLLESRVELSPPPRAVESLVLELVDFGAPASQADLFDRREKSAREAGGHALSEGNIPDPLKEAVRELKLRLGHSPLYRVVEMDPFSRIPERRHALLNFDPT